MRVDVLREEQAEAYDRYLLTKEYTLFYHCTKYKHFLRALLRCGEEYLVALRAGRICGCLPLMFTQHGDKRVYNSLPYYGSNGGIIADDQEAHDALVASYNEIARCASTISATIIENPLAPTSPGDVLHNYVDCRIGQFSMLPVAADPWNAIVERIEPSALRNVKKALREGVVIAVDHGEIDALRRMHQANIAAIGGLAKSDEFFRLVERHFAPGDDYDLYVARQDGAVVAGLLVFYFNTTVEYYMPAIEHEARSTQPLSLVLITAMADAARRGFRRWNWGGTWLSQTGVYRFKRKWGASEKRYLYYTQLNEETVLCWTRDEILRTFPNFFVVPFSALAGQPASAVGGTAAPETQRR